MVPATTAASRGCVPGMARTVTDFGSMPQRSSALRKKNVFISPGPTSPTVLPTKSWGFFTVFGWPTMLTVGRLVEVAMITRSPPAKFACTGATPALCDSCNAFANSAAVLRAPPAMRTSSEFIPYLANNFSSCATQIGA